MAATDLTFMFERNNMTSQCSQVLKLTNTVNAPAEFRFVRLTAAAQRGRDEQSTPGKNSPIIVVAILALSHTDTNKIFGSNIRDILLVFRHENMLVDQYGALIAL